MGGIKLNKFGVNYCANIPGYGCLNYCSIPCTQWIWYMLWLLLL